MFILTADNLESLPEGTLFWQTMRVRGVWQYPIICLKVGVQYFCYSGDTKQFNHRHTDLENTFWILLGSKDLDCGLGFPEGYEAGEDFIAYCKAKGFTVLWETGPIPSKRILSLKLI